MKKTMLKNMNIGEDRISEFLIDNIINNNKDIFLLSYEKLNTATVLRNQIHDFKLSKKFLTNNIVIDFGYIKNVGEEPVFYKREIKNFSKYYDLKNSKAKSFELKKLKKKFLNSNFIEDYSLINNIKIKPIVAISTIETIDKENIFFYNI